MDTYSDYGPAGQTLTALPGIRHFFLPARTFVHAGKDTSKRRDVMSISSGVKHVNASSGFGSAGRLRSASDFRIDRAMFPAVKLNAQRAMLMPTSGHLMRVVSRAEPAGYNEDMNPNNNNMLLDPADPIHAEALRLAEMRNPGANDLNELKDQAMDRLRARVNVAAEQQVALRRALEKRLGDKLATE